MPRAPKRAQQLAEQIEREILDQRLPSGHRLGTEPELTERYGVSRAVLREAIRMVERHQLAVTRRGTGGGLFVAQPAEEGVSRVLSAYLDSIGIGLEELFEARQLVEGEMARYAALRGGKRGGRALEAILTEGSQPTTVSAAVDMFDRVYSKLGELSRSPGLALFARTLNLAGSSLALERHFDKEDRLDRYRRTWSTWLLISKEIAARDAERARAKICELLSSQEDAWKMRKRRRTPLTPPGAIKRGDALARAIRKRIREERLQPGDRLGSEAELLEHYEVSRAALREGVRLLEEHGLVDMRRGLGGGLVVSEPDPDSVVRSASVYLAHLGLTVEQLKEVRMLLEPQGVAWVAERASDDEIAEVTAELVERLNLRDAEGANAFRELHEHFADLSGNRAIALFTRVMITGAWGLNHRTITALPDDALESLRHSDTRIVGAINERDPDRAAQLMRDHLEVTLDWWTALQTG
jgi:DNA-binding FadR family transcriptional regulator